MTKKVLVGGSVVIVVILLLLLSNTEKSATSPLNETTNATTAEGVVKVASSLIVEPQPDVDVVRISRASLAEGGFLAVREVDGGRLGQIIEISDYLAVGVHDNVLISLGEFYEGDEELIVMIYEDAENDQIFNDLDQPYEKNGAPIAVYVETGEVVPKSIVSNTGTPEGISLMDMGSMQFISYTDSGFEPKDITVTRGTMVHFVNESSIDMWVASDDHPAHTDLPTFDQFKGSPPGEQYVYIFDQAGEWKYHDHLTPTAVGTITVTN